MGRLPRELLPWEAEIGVLPRDLQLAIGPWLVRLALALGPRRAPVFARGDDVDGLGGLSRRGPYDRLVMSEWALADAHPDEFLRRAANGEQLFLEISRREPVGKGRTVALFDAGPDQLGAPRLAHIALALVLARRARLAGASYDLGALQGALSPWEGPERVAWLMRARSFRCPVPKDLAVWREHLDRQADSEVDEDRWWIGAPSMVETRDLRLDRRNALVSVVEDADAGILRVRVEIGAIRRDIRLELPPPEIGEALIVHPFRLPEAPRPPRPKSASPLLPTQPPTWETPPVHTLLRFSDDGRRLIGRNAEQIVALYVPNSSTAIRSGRARVRDIRPGTQLLAVGWPTPDKQVIAVTRHEGEMFWNSTEIHLRPPLSEDPAGIGAAVNGGGGARWLLLGNALYAGRGSVLHKRNDPAFGVVKRFGAVHAVSSDGALVHESQIPYGQKEPAAFTEIPGFIACDGSTAIAVPSRGGVWKLRSAHAKTPTEIAIPTNAQVVGLTRDRLGNVVLVVIRARKLLLVGAGPAQVWEAPGVITSACASPTEPIIGFRLASGEVGLWSAVEEKVWTGPELDPGKPDGA